MESVRDERGRGKGKSMDLGREAKRGSIYQDLRFVSVYAFFLYLVLKHFSRINHQNSLRQGSF